MSIRSTHLFKNTLENRLLVILFVVFFLFFIFQTPLYSPDTYSYLRADITRFPGYILYLRGLRAIFGNAFDIIAVAGHLLMGFAALIFFYKWVAKQMKLSVIAKILLLVVLLFPFFPPIGVALNLTSEGIAYPLYLVLLRCTLDLIFNDKHNQIVWIALSYILLVLTRGQFVIVAPIIAFVILLKWKRSSITRQRILYMILLLLLPMVANVLDRTYRYAFYAQFRTTPYSYVNAVALPLYVGDKEDSKLFTSKDVKTLYDRSYRHLDSLQLLSSEIEGSYNDKYLRFHYNFPKICNQNIHQMGLSYYLEQGLEPPQHAFAIEETSKTMFTELLSDNFSKWAALYYTSIVHGFKSVFILAFVLAIAIVSFWKAIKRFTFRNGFVLLATLLILSNAMIVAVASHSIMRYLFYNYALGLLIIIILLKKFIPSHES